jgi:hypothetical protein
MSEQSYWDQSYPPSLWAPPEPPPPAPTPTGARGGGPRETQGAKAPQTLEEAPTLKPAARFVKSPAERDRKRER